MKEEILELAKNITKDDLKKILQDIFKETLKDVLKEISEEDATFNIEEASEYSGIGTWNLRQLIRKENTDFPFLKVGTKALIHKKLLDEWLIQAAKEHREI